MPVCLRGKDNKRRRNNKNPKRASGISASLNLKIKAFLNAKLIGYLSKMASRAGKIEKQRQEEQPQIIRVRTPRGDEVLGIIEQRVGANRMIVKCLDGKERNCRIPGALRRGLWIRPGDTVIVKPWEFDGDKRGDVIYKYTPASIEWLKRKGFLKEVENEF
jgi:translation initiation factor 1A